MGLFKRKGPDQQGQRYPAKSVLAAAIPLSGPGAVRVGKQFKAGTHDWQNEVWYFYDVVGEFRAAVTWVANAVSKADLFAAETDPETGLPTGPTEDARAQAAALAVLGGPSQRAQLLQTLAVHWQVPGESFIIIRSGATRGRQQAPDEWLVLSGSKVVYKGSSWEYVDPQTLAKVVLEPRDRLIRVWSPHPNDPVLSDSAARPALPTLREIEKSSQHIAATLDSRLGTAGILPIPSEMNFPHGEDQSMAQAFTDFFLDVVSANIKTPGTAEARVPVVVEMPGEMIPAFSEGFMDLATAFDSQVVEDRKDALQRLAATLDMPNETAEGSTGGMNHWGAWQVEESTYKIYIQPLLERIGDALTNQWFHEALRLMGEPNPERFTLAWNTDSIVSRPDRTAELKELWDDVLISDDYRRAQAGIPDEAVPSDDERVRRTLLSLVSVAPTLLADPAIAEALELGIEVAPAAAGVATADVTAEVEPGQEQNALPSAQESGEPPEGLVAAAEFAVFDALSRAGKRLLTREHRGQFGHVKAEELYLSIPHERASSELLEGSFAFIDPVADAYGLGRPELERALRSYASYCLGTREPYDRALLRSTLKQAMR